MPPLQCAFRITFVVVAGLLISGCASTTSIPPTLSFRDFPPIGERASASVGSPLLLRAKINAFEGLYLTEPVTVKGSGINIGARWELSPGEFVATEGDEKWTYYRAILQDTAKVFALGTRTDSIEVIEDGEKTRVAQGRTGVRQNKSTGKFEAFHLLGSLLSNCPIPDANLFERRKITTEKSSGFKRELLYNGKSGSTVRLLYREFINDLARPAFTQELTYDLSESDLVGFQEVRLRIFTASNTLIEYEVIRGFPAF